MIPRRTTKIAAGYFAITLTSILFLSCIRKDQGKEKNLPTNRVVIDWNEMTYTIANQHDHFYSFIGIRALTMTHIAIHDALNAIDRKYRPYAFSGNEPNADPTAACSQAAYEILMMVYPNREDTIKSVLNAWMDSVPEGNAKTRGIALGKKSAQAILQLRENDGHQANGDYTPMTKPGDYQYTPEFEGYVWKPDFSQVLPFTLDSLTQFRSPLPPELNSDAYTASYNEVKLYGTNNSDVRDADQTNFAHWWAEFAEHGWNRIGRITAAERNLSLWETARMFALINMDIYDIYLVSFDSKYFYDTWRPYTAIRQGEQDGNPNTKGDPDWQPEMLTPPWPEYPSAHAAVGAGGAEIVKSVFGTPKVSFTMKSTMALPESQMRSYRDLDSAAQDCADSRIMNGFHFRFATEEGMQQGRKVARHVVENFLQPVK